MEAMLVKLCKLFPSPTKKGSQTTLRFIVVCSAYNKIRETVLGNGKVMSDINIQLAEINQKTLT